MNSVLISGVANSGWWHDIHCCMSGAGAWVGSSSPRAPKRKWPPLPHRPRRSPTVPGRWLTHCARRRPPPGTRPHLQPGTSRRRLARMRQAGSAKRRTCRRITADLAFGTHSTYHQMARGAAAKCRTSQESQDAFAGKTPMGRLGLEPRTLGLKGSWPGCRPVRSGVVASVLNGIRSSRQSCRCWSVPSRCEAFVCTTDCIRRHAPDGFDP
jgi:hypothetical protein